MSVVRLLRAGVVVGVGMSAACNALIGIEESHVDPLSEPPEVHEHSEIPSEAGMSVVEDAGDDATELSLCERYCQTVTANCTEAAAVYSTEEVCRAACALLPEGSPGDEIGNTVHCRLLNAELARTTGEVAVHCPSAGPGGNGVCGDDCEGYCMLFAGACGASFGENFLGLPDCVQRCAELPRAESYDVSFTSGNTVQCRLYHVCAATADPNRHCAHAAGEPPCAD